MKEFQEMGRIIGLSVILVLCLGNSSTAQTTNATVTGRITDASQAAIPGAKVTLTNTGTNLHYEGVTNDTGGYNFTLLPPGAYRMQVEKSGFQTLLKSDMTLHVGEALEINLEMAVGTATQIVTVAAETPNVDRVSSSIGEVISDTTVRELPLNGRSWTDLAALQAGVERLTIQTPFSGLGTARAARGLGSEVTIAGGRPTQNNYQVDGTSINDYANAGPGSVLGGNLGVDAIQEFSILTSGFPAEYGNSSGGVINAITRAGTNQYHGSAYEFLRNSALDARNYFDPAKIPPFRRNQFGGAIGGPIKKNRTFFFVDYEGVRQYEGLSTLDMVPSAAARNGQLCSVPTSGCTPKTVTVDPSAAKYLQFWPLPNGGLVPGAAGDTGFFTFTANNIDTENFVTGRIDHTFSEKDSISGSYIFDRNPYTSPDSLNQVINSVLSSRQTFTAQETHIFSSRLVNVVRFGFNRVFVNDLLGVSAINPAAIDKSLASFPGYNAAQVVISGGVTSFGGGLYTLGPKLFRWNTFQEYDDATLTAGNHSLKFGVSVERMQQNESALDNPGKWTFASLQNFLTNHPKQLAANFDLGSRHFRQTLVGVYAQDDWKIRSNLTLNLGLRYEMTTVLSDVYGQLSNLRNLTDTSPHLGSPFTSNPTLLNFEPRVGFAFDPFHDGKTSIRAAFGFYDVLPMIYQIFVNQNTTVPFGLRSVINNPPAGSFFAGAPPLIKPTNFVAEHVEPNPSRNYVMQWNLNVQRELTPSLSVMVGYVGSRGVHQLFKSDDVDAVLPQLTSAGYLYPAPIGSGAKINKAFGGIQAIYYNGNSSYHGLITEVRKRMSHGLQFDAMFTYQKSIDEGSMSGVGDTFVNALPAQPFYDPSFSRGPSDFNVPRALVLNAVWQVPTAKSLSGIASRFTDGWQLATILTASDGMPFTPLFGTNADPMGTLASTNYGYPDRLTGPGCATYINPGNPNNYVKQQCFTLPTAPSLAFWTANCDTTSKIYGPNKTTEPYPVCLNLAGNVRRNSLPGPGVLVSDFSLAKNNYIKLGGSENGLNVQFRAEFFNALNHSNFVGPASSSGGSDIFTGAGVPNSAGGRLIATSTSSRQIQFAIKLIF
jgi:outer membrane receptor protein involved in Fe transport